MLGLLCLAVLALPSLGQAQVTTNVNFTVTIPPDTGNVRFLGDAFPGALVTILDNNVTAGTTIANGQSAFDKTLTGLQPGVHTFGLFGSADDGSRTLTISFDILVISGSTVTVSGILLPPILSVPTTNLRPRPFNESGKARHSSTVTTFTDNHGQITKQVTSDTAGNWTVPMTEVLHLGTRTVAALVNDGNGNQSTMTDTKPVQVLISADLNIDDKTNLTDFSILMFNYGTNNPPNRAADINDDGPADLVDFSVMMFYWTGI